MNDFPAPFVKSSPIKIGLSFEEEQVIQVNQTRLIVGRIEQLIVPDSALDQDGRINFETQNLTGVSGLDTYYSFKKLGTYPFARP